LQKHQLPFPLLIDEGGAVAETYGSYGPEKSSWARNLWGSFATASSLTRQAWCKKIYRKVKPETPCG
jgi:peroxiredoxin Q/BCP